MNAVKITHPLWLPAIAPRIDELVKISNTPSITYEGLFVYLQNAVMQGRDFSEVWVAFDEEKEPRAFTHWHVCGPPMTATVACDFAYSWSKNNKEAHEVLAKEFVRFGQRNRCVLYKVLSLDEKRFRFFRAFLKKHGIDLQKQGYVHSIGRKG